jgi:hypothetical protein
MSRIQVSPVKRRRQYTIAFLRHENDQHFFSIEVTGDDSRRFTGWVTGAESIYWMNEIESAIERWCEARFDELPTDSRTIAIRLGS